MNETSMNYIGSPDEEEEKKNNNVAKKYNDSIGGEAALSLICSFFAVVTAVYLKGFSMLHTEGGSGDIILIVIPVIFVLLVISVFCGGDSYNKVRKRPNNYYSKYDKLAIISFCVCLVSLFLIFVIMGIMI